MSFFQIQSLLLTCIKLAVIFHITNALYEDQIKKFDWRKLNVGKIFDASFDFDDRILVATNENVLSALCPRTGEIIWRQVFEKSPRGDLKLFQIQKSSTSASIRNSNIGHDLITVSGNAPALIRGWSASTGNLEWEWSLTPIQIEKAENSIWFYDNYHLYHIIPIWNSHLEVSKYFASSGQGKGTTSKISAPWIHEESCFLSAPYYVCCDKNQLISLDLTSSEAQVLRKTLPFQITSKPKTLNGPKGVVLINDQIISLENEEINCNDNNGYDIFYSEYLQRSIIIKYKVVDNQIHIKPVYADDCQEVDDLQVSMEYPQYYGKPKMYGLNCKNRINDETVSCSFLVSSEDGAIILIKQGKIRWVREESLANIVATELIDLPLSDAEGAIESELNSKPGDIVGACIRRIATQISHIKNVILTVLGLGQPPTASQKAGLVRDAFGLHKMIVFVTKSGKIFGIDNLTGKQHWVKYLPTIENFNNDENMKLLIQRTSKHFPYQPICIIIARDTATGNGVLYRFNPISGQPIDGGLIKLNYQIRQFALLPELESDFVKGVLLLDQYNSVHVLPETAKERADGMYLFTADKSQATLSGYFVQLMDNKLMSVPIWKNQLGGHGNIHKITAIAAKNPIEHVHSQGRVLSDRSVLYKYINPNLVAVVTQALDNIHKYVMNIHLIDVVSGSVVFSMIHRKVRGPLHIVHSENWLAYSYYNDKVRRTELTTIELYEGKIQANSTIWSSLDAPPLPIFERQSYIFPATVETMRETITERGITNKHILMGLSTGGILEMPWAVLDPRRPVSTHNQVREEGSIPYIPELPVSTENLINYNQSISRIKNIFTAPSGLESTCLVVAYGLDLFVTRVSPSKTFDLLKEDFDYFLITVVLIGLITGSFVVKHLSSRKALKQAWK